MDNEDDREFQSAPLKINDAAKVGNDSLRMIPGSTKSGDQETGMPFSNTDSSMSLVRERNDVPLPIRVIVLISFLTASFFINVDGGVFAPALLSIEKDLNISDM